MKKLIKKLLPEPLVLWYHYVVALMAAAYYGHPGKKMIVIGVTGTKGKTSTANFIWACLSSGGLKTGLISTANIRIGQAESLNKYHMTMPGRFTTQRLMAEMVKEGCRFCVLETTSEGIKQSRHVGAYYDLAVFTNLSPEHLPSHGGSFERYKETKGKMFQALSSHRKTIAGGAVKKVVIANKDNEHASYFLSFPADKKITFALKNEADYTARNIQEKSDGVSFEAGGSSFTIRILGGFNVWNALPAIIIGRLFGLSDDSIQQGFETLTLIPGRMEVVNEGQEFTVLVDYAHEKQSMTRVLEAANKMKLPNGRVIVSLGAEGGGRDKTKRPAMGEVAAKLADFVVVTNVDPYEDDPKEILEDIACASEVAGKVRNQNLFVVEDRRLGIRQSLSLAKPGDVVVITGKGAEQSIQINGQTSPWDDRLVVREELVKLQSH